MNQDKIHDALNLLEDDMIESVDKLRNRKKKPKRNVTRWMSLAACFGVIMLGIYATGGFSGKTKREATRGDMDMSIEVEKNDNTKDNVGIDENESGKTENLTEEEYGFAVGENSSGQGDIPSAEVVEDEELQEIGVLIEIISIENSGFTGKTRKENALVFVTWENVSEISVGDVVCVQFDREKTEVKAGKVILYAEDVEIAE